MKAATIYHLALGLLITSFFSLPPQSLAQDSDYPEPWSFRTIAAHYSGNTK